MSSLKALWFLAGLTLFGVISVPLFFQWVSDRVTKNVSDKIDRDTERLRDRVDSNLADIAVQKTELEKGLTEAKSDLTSLHEQIETTRKVSTDYQSNTKKLQEIQGGYETLQVRVENLKKGVDHATVVAENSRQSTAIQGAALSAVGGALTAFSSNEPSIFAAPVSFGPLIPRGTILGANFGENQGHVYVEALVLPAAYGSGVLSFAQSLNQSLSGGTQKVIDLGAEGIVEWRQDKITIAYNSSVAEQLDALGNGSQVYSYQVETANGTKSPWAIGTSLLQ